MAMTPKEKAEQLAGKMCGMTYSQRISNSIIAVEEVLSVINVHTMEDENAYKYWQEVKNELLKLK